MAKTITIKELYELIQKSGKVFLTGAGGVGKSYVTRHLINYCRAPIILGSTGIASSNIGGDTVHSFFKLGLSKNIKELEAYTNSGIEFMKKIVQDDPAYLYWHNLRKSLQQTDMIIIDEVSMVSNVLLDMIKHQMALLGFYGKIPFLFVGDMYQLPPVSKDNSAGYIFNSPEWQGTKIIELKEIKRTDNIDFAKLQGNIRIGKPTKENIEYIKGLSSNVIDEDSTRLLPTNKEVNAYNDKKLKELSGRSYRTRPKIIYKDKNITDKQVASFLDDSKIPEELLFKVGAKVIFITNDSISGYFNGELGEIVEVKSDTKEMVIKSLFNSNTYKIGRKRFEKFKIKATNKPTLEPVLTISAYPFKLGYAITIHKSQGMTLTQGLVNCSRIFTPEQFYVALSRFSNPDKLRIVNFEPKKHISRNREVEKFYAESEVLDIDGIETGRNKNIDKVDFSGLDFNVTISDDPFAEPFK